MRRFLVVANQTLGGQPLIERIRLCLSEGPCRFHLVVPATPPGEQLTWTEGQSAAIAQERLDRALARFNELGAEAEGEVGDKNPILAIRDALRNERFDEIILSTLPPGISKWLRLDLPTRVAARFNLPVVHIISEAEAA